MDMLEEVTDFLSESCGYPTVVIDWDDLSEYVELGTVILTGVCVELGRVCNEGKSFYVLTVFPDANDCSYPTVELFKPDDGRKVSYQAPGAAAARSVMGGLFKLNIGN